MSLNICCCSLFELSEEFPGSQKRVQFSHGNRVIYFESKFVVQFFFYHVQNSSDRRTRACESREEIRNPCDRFDTFGIYVNSRRALDRRILKSLCWLRQAKKVFSNMRKVHRYNSTHAQVSSGHMRSIESNDSFSG